MSELLVKELLTIIPQVGKLEWIGVRPAYRAPVQVVASVRAEAGLGLIGDRYAECPGTKRQLTLIQAEHLPAIAALTGHAAIPPEWLRRNLVVSGINLLALKDRSFRIGAVLLEGTGLCQPCSRMEEVLGPGGYNAMRGHGGITAHVLNGGNLCVGDRVVHVPEAARITEGDAL
jgi:MOSC domain-containing protein YiiM